MKACMRYHVYTQTQQLPQICESQRFAVTTSCMASSISGFQGAAGTLGNPFSCHCCACELHAPIWKAPTTHHQTCTLWTNSLREEISSRECPFPQQYVYPIDGFDPFIPFNSWEPHNGQERRKRTKESTTTKPSLGRQ
jgi:hypothetical protein